MDRTWCPCYSFSIDIYSSDSLITWQTLEHHEEGVALKLPHLWKTSPGKNQSWQSHEELLSSLIRQSAGTYF